MPKGSNDRDQMQYLGSDIQQSLKNVANASNDLLLLALRQTHQLAVARAKAYDRKIMLEALYSLLNNHGISPEPYLIDQIKKSLED